MQSLVRGLNVIRAFDADHPQMTLTEIAAQTSLTRATARRFLLTLVEIGYLQTDGRLFSLTPRVLELGFSYLSALTLPEIAQPTLEELSRITGESSSASVLDRTEIVYVARVAVRRIMSVSISVGTRFPAASTSMGRVLLADLAPDALATLLDAVHFDQRTSFTLHDRAALEVELGRVRTAGHALVDQELELGLRSLAAPITTRAGVVAAINVSVSAGTFTPARMRETLLPPLLTAAATIATNLDAATPAPRR
ncbi:IclR family transcriptional regulator domain-containing protein [Subtercola boreus]|uniref:IclR family transcriptional regulator n=1 Tax=Subtercola boreus TaxID=120213 RepID=A0A3E0WBS6_9MICO|nr:IclR family transcriptional regulator C-terminal domain-containing protein [Subtercola boreus]RFA19497.1 IclR family transcriptional regulator [Subtercola boreus]RFA19757.1 IclR family transcriptional regulator [Subtercola boreus]RFA26123.1 IclR family transcriptional regulator [Subtercola boreus]